MARDKVCPACGFENRRKADICELCQAPFAAGRGSQSPLMSPVVGENSPNAASTASPPAQRSDFMAEAAVNRRKSMLLMMVFFGLVAALGFGIGFSTGRTVDGGLLGLGIAAFVASLYMLLVYYRGGGMMMSVAGGREVTAGDPEFRQVYNIVEEMAIASGLPQPRVFVVMDAAPNAFATGRDPEHAAIAVTSGLVEKLNREELQGVIGHEMAHVASYDIRFMMLAAVLVGVVALLSDYFLRFGLFRRGRIEGRSGGGGQVAILIFVLTIVLAILAPLAARFLQMAVSRKRELLADARAVEFTRNPSGLAGALKKISEDGNPLLAANRATQHMYIVNPLKSFSRRAGGLFATHPPIEMRLALLQKMGASF